MLGPEKDGMVEAEVRARFAAELGVPVRAVVVEPGGHTTRDEARLVAGRLSAFAPLDAFLASQASLKRPRRSRQRPGPGR